MRHAAVHDSMTDRGEPIVLAMRLQVVRQMAMAPSCPSAAPSPQALRRLGALRVRAPKRGDV
jgi:hypothetical protein